MAKIQTIKINNEVVYPRTIKQAIVDLQGTPTIITNDGSEAGSVAIILTENGSYQRTFRIDMTAEYTGGANEQRIGSLIIECWDEGDDIAHGYYYGDDMSGILTEVAVYQDDQDSGIFYLMLTHDIILNSVTFAITPLDGGEVDAIITNAGDDHTKIADATISPVGGGSSDVFWATYGTTTASEIDAAVNAGKVVLVYYNKMLYVMSQNGTTHAFFTSITTATNYFLQLTKTSDTWIAGNVSYQLANRASSITSSNYNSSTFYPSLAALNGSLYKWGVISQTQTWTQASDGGYDYTIAPASIVRGIIPQANIDLFESAGATFNSGTGYFELNGLTDISYEEMIDIYLTFAGDDYRRMNRKFYGVRCRTNIVAKWFGYSTTSAACEDPTFTNGLAASLMEVVVLPPAIGTSLFATSVISSLMYNSNYLHTIINPLKYEGSTAPSGVSLSAPSLRDFQMNSIKWNLTIPSQVFSKDSLLYMINNEAATSAITITLHASVYAKCQSGGEWYSDINTALSAHTNVSLASA